MEKEEEEDGSSVLPPLPSRSNNVNHALTSQGIAEKKTWLEEESREEVKRRDAQEISNVQPRSAAW